MTIDGRKQRGNGVKYLDFVVHYADQSIPSSSIHSRVLLIEILTGEQSSANMPDLLAPHFLALLGIDFSKFMRRFTLVTDCGANVPGIVGTSVSQNVFSLDHRWMACVGHILNNVKKHAMLYVEKR